jgi:hypothetical protein
MTTGGMGQMFEARLAELRRLRDEIRLQIHLAGRDLHDQWQHLDRRMPEAVRVGRELRDVTTGALDELIEDVKAFRERMKEPGGKRDSTEPGEPPWHY